MHNDADFAAFLDNVENFINRMRNKRKRNQVTDEDERTFIICLKNVHAELVSGMDQLTENSPLYPDLEDVDNLVVTYLDEMNAA